MTGDGPRLTRRDAVVALGTAGAALGAGIAANRVDGSPLGDPASPFGQRELRTLEAVAEVVYPADLGGISGFVETFSVGRMRDRPAYAEGVADAVDALDSRATAWFDGAFADLAPDRRDRVLREMRVDDADPDPSGADRERVRYYLVNELLFALYASPTGGRLVGLENPQGHAGGLSSYQRGPEP